MKSVIIALLASVLCLGGAAEAQETGQSEFEQGIARFSQADYRGALGHFLAAKNAGMEEPRLEFNLGVCHYKLGQYAQAREAFLRAAAHPPMRDLAHFNIGLVEEAGNRAAEARQWYQRVFAETENAKLKVLAGDKLEPAQQSARVDKGRSWFGGYSVALGYDDNIEDPTQLGVAGKGDSFVDLLLYGDVLLLGGVDNGLHLGANAYLARYQDVSIYDMNLVQASLDQTFRSGTWQDTAGVSVERITLGSTDFLQTVKLTLAAGKRLGDRDDLRLRYRYSDVASLDPIYDKLEGSRHEAELRWQRRGDGRRLRLSYEYEVNDRNDFQGATTFSSYSPTRHTLELRASASGRLWELDGRLSLRRSLYADDNVLAGGIRIAREDDRVLLGAKLSRTLLGTLKGYLEYKYIDNNSTITSYDYIRNVYSLGLSGGF